jgi:Family of unknown function (DUF5990)
MTRSRTAVERTIRVSLICEAAPTSTGMEFGVQDKSGALTPGTSEPDGSLRFEHDILEVTLEDGTVRLRGDTVYGPTAAPFLYLSCRRRDEPKGPWMFRLKIPLAGMPADARWVEARVRASAGGTVPLLGRGWTARPRAVARARRS